MKKIITLTLILFIILACEKDPKKEQINNDVAFLQEHIFNGKTQWVVSRMEADTEREINGQSTTIWSEHFPGCRNDNVYSFGKLPIENASIHVEEGSSTCDPEEPTYVPQGLFLEFSSDFKKAAASIRGAAMAKLFDLPYDSRIQLNGFDHTWEFEEVSAEKVLVKVLIPENQSAGMVEKAATVWITFERH